MDYIWAFTYCAVLQKKVNKTVYKGRKHIHYWNCTILLFGGLKQSCNSPNGVESTHIHKNTMTPTTREWMVTPSAFFILTIYMQAHT